MPAGASAAAGLAPGAQARIEAQLLETALDADRRHGIGAGLVVVAVAAFALQRQGVPGDVWLWAATCWVLAAARFAVLARARRGAAAPRPAGASTRSGRAWMRLFALYALAWGAGPLIALSRQPDLADLVTGIWLGAAALLVPTVVSSRRAIYLWLLPSLMPLLLSLLAFQAPDALLMACIAGPFFALLLRLVLNQNDALRAGLSAQFANAGLVEDLVAQVELAERANQEKTRFLASAVHDLRQPLHALGLFCAALEKRLRDIPERPLIRNMMDSIESLEASFGAMLDIARLDAGVVRTSVHSFAIRDLFRRLYQQFGGDAEERDLSLRFRAARRWVTSDPQLLERILSNLVQNALRYTKTGGVLVAARRHGEGVALEVWDTGIGIPADKMDVIFEEFYQIENPERDRARGLGMGLAIVRRLCNLLGHRLDVMSRQARGTRFRVLVPAGDAVNVAQPDLEADTLPPRVQTRVTVLLVDDERAIREATRELLRPMQIEVLTAGGIEEALDVVAAHPGTVDLLLSDWRLRGGENGIEAVQALRRVCGESTPAVLVTGDTSAEVLKLAHESGLVVLHKPLQARELLALIGKFAR